MQTADARRMNELQRKFDEERRRRLAAEQRAAGLRSAILKMQARIAQRDAEDLARRANLNC